MTVFLSSAHTPVMMHIFFAGLTLAAWIVLRFVDHKTQVISLVGRNSKKLQFGIGITTIIAFTALVYYAFNTRHIVGVELIERWGWLDSQYLHQAVYAGEWPALWALYLFPLGAPFLFACWLTHDERPLFISSFFRRYPLIILLSYIVMLCTMAITGTELKRAETFPTEEVPEGPGEWRH